MSPIAPGQPFWRGRTFIVVAALHALALAALVHWQVRQPEDALAQILSVRLVEPEKPRVVEPKPLPPPVKAPPRSAPVAPLPVLAASTQAPAAPAFVVPPQPPAPPAPPPVQAAAPPPLVSARFDADYLHNPKPIYPSLSRRLGEEGKVLLRVRVSAEGRALEVEVRQSSGYPRLDAAARDAVLQWRFVPARQGDAPVDAWVGVPIVFKLDS